MQVIFICLIIPPPIIKAPSIITLVVKNTANNTIYIVQEAQSLKLCSESHYRLYFYQ